MKLPRLQIKAISLNKLHTIHYLLLLFCACICIYTITYSGIFRVDDEHILASRAQSYALWAGWEEPQVAGNQRVQELIPYGDQATQIEPGLSYIGSLVYQLGLRLDLGGMQALLTTNIYITTLTVLCIFILVRVLGYKNRTASWCAFAFGFGSMAWPYASTFYRDSLVMLMAAITLIGWAIILYQDCRYRWLGSIITIIGILGGLLSKNSMLAVIPALVLGVLFEARKKAKWKELGLITGIILLFLLLLSWLIPARGPLARASLEYYRTLALHFQNNIHPSTILWILGPFISPAKSIFLFSPVLILLPWAWKSSWKNVPSWSVTALAFPILLAIAQALFYGERWMGDFGWGLRFLLPALPGLMGILAGFVARGHEKKRQVLLLIAMIGVGILVQIGASTVDWGVPYSQWIQSGLDPYGPQSAWSIRTLAIPWQFIGLADPGQWTLAWYRTTALDPRSRLIPLVSMLLLLTTIFSFSLSRRGKLRWVENARWIGISIAVSLLPLIPSLIFLQKDPYWGRDVDSYQQGLDAVMENISHEDIVLLDSYGTPLWNVWMNQWDRPNPWISLPYEIISNDDGLVPGTPKFDIESNYILDGLHTTGSVWYVGSDRVPDFLNRDELRWFEAHYEQCDQWEYGGEVFVDVRHFTLVACD
ncbi:MAG: hypothetical protein MUO58_03715 [Anaerolineales bacterium]|nr:hypothetical protein [Anaerolineales bacterium]